MRHAAKFGLTIVGMLFLAHTAAAQFVQQGGKLVGTGAGPGAGQGRSAAISADGNTAIVGGPGAAFWYWAGAAWIYTRVGGTWLEQAKLVGTGATGIGTLQGWSVAISADGNTAIVGGPGDGTGPGTAWVFTRAAGVWSQQGAKLVGTGIVGTAQQGNSVAIAADGNTLIVGGPSDNSGAGAAWVFIRSGDVWSQQGAKLVGTGAVGTAQQASSVAISADGNTAVVGGPNNNGGAGAVWVFTRGGSAWAEQGKLVGTGALNPAFQGTSLGISANGSTVIVGGYNDNVGAGAAWVFTRSGGAWSQQGSKLFGTGAVAGSQQGQSVSISADGNTAIVGGWSDNSGVGAAWMWTRSGGVWSQQGSKLVGVGAIGNASQGYSVAISADNTTAIAGGINDNSGAGAAWVFVSSATRLALVQQPTTTTAGQQITPAVTVQLQDVNGNPVAQGGMTITMSLSGTGTLSGTVSRATDAAGLATFNDLSIDMAGAKQLTAASPSRTSAVSATFLITAATTTSIVATGGTSQSAPINTPFAQPLQVTVTDAFDNPAVGALVTYAVPGSGPSASLSGGGSATTDASGRASVIATANVTVGGPYSVLAATGTLPPVAFRLTNTPAAAADQIPVLDGVGLALLASLLALTALKALSRH